MKVSDARQQAYKANLSQIWKYALEVQDTNHIDMPMGAQVLTVQMQGDVPTVWAMVKPSRSPEMHIISMIGTGQTFNADFGRYIGTVQLHGENEGVVVHVFDWNTMGNGATQEA